MRGVFKGFRRSGVMLALLTILLAQVAVARGSREEPGWRQRFDRARRFIVTMLSRFEIPPGQPLSGTTLQAPTDAAVTTEK